MAPGTGYWGKQTATVDWCEENYVVSYYIAEFWNTLSNVAIILSPLLMLIVGYKQQHEKRFIYSFLAITVVGIGSLFFHMTLQYSMQLMDELPMLWASACFIYVALMTKSKYNEDNSLLQIALFITCVIITVMYILVEFPEFLQVSYGLLNVTAIVTQLKLMMTVECKKRYFILGLAFYLVGFCLWNVDNIYCHHLRSIRLHTMANSAGILFQCHAWWHILSGFGAYLGLLFA
ncbi:unnamed protein product [Candidula unifasciata]|uniref:Alkaline ceramidase n=1 Tax=Candidula unifasciata TaxID=100452 RepID=A0A8S3ZGZ6_9EUPU|nr:unnamed protein product [Candidula unifasciata]